jgi:phytanoyl-CoA hydroxylase
LTIASLFTFEQLDKFNRDGFVVVRGLARPDLCDRMKAVAREHLDKAIPPVEYEADLRYPGAPRSRGAEGGGTVRRLLQAYSREPLFREWAASRELRSRLAQKLGPDVMLAQAHHNCVMTKHPRFGSLTGWHQDIRYWAFRRPELVSVWLALGTERDPNGCLWVVPGSHALELSRERFDDAVFFREDMDANRVLVARRIFVELEPHDVLFFHCRLLHAAGPNRGDEVKLSVVFTYRSAGNPAIEGSRSASPFDISLSPTNRG